MRLPRFGGALLLAAMAGVLQAVSLAVPGWGDPLWMLQVLSLAGLVHLLQQQTGRPWRGFFLGWAFATAWLAATFWWLFISMHVYGGLPSVLAVSAVLALAAFLALDYAVAAAAFVRWRRGHLTDAVLFASAWLLAELARGQWYTGFPWGAGGYAHVDGSLRGLASWLGVYGIGAVAAAMAALLALAGGRVARRGPAIVLALVLLAVGVLATFNRGSVPTPGAPLEVALLQGNIPQDEKFHRNTGVATALEWYAQQLHDVKAALVVTPETAIPVLPHQLPLGYLDAVGGFFRTGDRAALAGIPLGNLNEGYTNSVLGWAPGAAYRYDKHHLVPFGEFIPPFFRWFTDLMNIPLGDFARGDVGQPSFAWKGQRLAPNICYEDLFGEELGARFTDPARAPTIFVNMSNIGWFGDSIAIDQHLHISRMRALEFARPMLRATNTGATAIIDRDGRVTALLPRFTRGSLTGSVEGGDGITPYAWWVARFGLWPLWIAGLAGVASCAAMARRAAPYNGRFREPESPS